MVDRVWEGGGSGVVDGFGWSGVAVMSKIGWLFHLSPMLLALTVLTRMAGPPFPRMTKCSPVLSLKSWVYSVFVVVRLLNSCVLV